MNEYLAEWIKKAEEDYEVANIFALVNDWLEDLNPYSVEFRYPGEFATPDEAKTAVGAMKNVREFIRGKL